ncbi:MAG: hypothetical protein Q7S19_02680 [bacterium]|nr:hypothetical protein [bacterium]
MHSVVGADMAVWPNLIKARSKVSPNFDGMMAPGLMFEVVCGGDLDAPLCLSVREQDVCLNSIYDYVSKHGDHLDNSYHNFPHFVDVEDHLWIVTRAKTPEEKFAKCLFPPLHDNCHPGKKSVRKLTVKIITALYDDKYTEYQILNTMNMMLSRDNEIVAERNKSMSEGKRRPMRPRVSIHDELDLTLEEMHAILADACLVRCGKKTSKEICLRVRALLNCFIKASDFMDLKNLPKTPFEWQIKLAAKANFLKPLKEWVKTSVKVNLEFPSRPTSVSQFIKDEIFFLDKMVKEAVLDNPATEGLFAPGVHYALSEKLFWLHCWEDDIIRLQNPASFTWLREAVQPLFTGEPPLL